MLSQMKSDKMSAGFAFEAARGLGEFAPAETSDASPASSGQDGSSTASLEAMPVQNTLQGLGIQLNEQAFAQAERMQAHSTVSDLLQTASVAQTVSGAASDVNAALASLNLSLSSGRDAAGALVNQALQSLMGGGMAPQLVPLDEEQASGSLLGDGGYLELLASVSDGLAARVAALTGSSTSTSSSTTTTVQATSPFHINLVWDASVNSAPSTFKTAIQAAASLLEQYIITPITVNIAVGWGEIGGYVGGYSSPVPANSAQGGTMGDIYQSYASIKQELTAAATSADDLSSIAALPATSPYGSVSYDVAGAQAKAFGLTPATSTALDGIVGFATNWPSADLIAAALHEISHAMGRNSGWASPTYGGDVSVLDLMRFSAPGVFADDGTKASTSALQYFSVDGGKTVLAHYALSSDLGDWYSDNLTLNDPNNAYLSSGSNALTKVDLRTLDVMGFTLVGSTAPQLPDLTIAALSPATTSVVQGTNLNFTYTVSDIGTAAAGASSATVMVDGALMSTAQIAALAANASTTFTGSISTSGLSVGSHTLTLAADSGGVISESNETNNQSSFTFTVTAAPSPDLVVSSLSTSTASVTLGNALTFTYQIADIGTASAGSSTTNYAIDGVVKGSFATVGLAAGATSNGSGTFSTTGLTVGSHTLTLLADANNVVVESNEANNQNSFTFSVTAPSSPDLIVSSLSTSAASVTLGNALTFNYQIADIGTASAGTTTTSYAIDGVVKGSFVTAGLAAGATSTGSGLVSTTGLSVGTHTLTVLADANNAVVESNEANNQNSFIFSVTAPTSADLIVSSLNTNASSVLQGTMLGFTYQIADIGTAAAAASTTSYAIDGVVKGSFATSSLAAGGFSLGSGSISTAGLSAGAHTLTLMADANNIVAESNESNNAYSTSFTVTTPSPSGAADLTITGLSSYSNSIVQGDTFVFAYNLKNSGTASAAASKVAYAIDTIPTSSNAYGTNSFGSLSANMWQYSPIDFIVTGNLSVGTHTLYVAADSGNTVSESNEANNVAALTFTVLGKSDFKVLSASAPDTIKAGSSFNLNYTITNSGQGSPNSYTYAAIYFDGRANAVSYDIIKNLSPGATQSITDTFSTYGVSKGTHTLTITSDALNFANESNELNNSKTVTFKIV